MKLSRISFLFLLLFLFGLSVGYAQTVPASVKKEILGYLKKQQLCKGEYVQFDVESIRVGPNKSGFIGSCRYGGGISVLYEKTPSGLKKLLEVEVGMNGGFGPTKKAYKGYYDISHYESGGGEVREEIYRWNGSRYVLRR